MPQEFSSDSEIVFDFSGGDPPPLAAQQAPPDDEIVFDFSSPSVEAPPLGVVGPEPPSDEIVFDFSPPKDPGGFGVSGPAIPGLDVTAGHITSLPDTLPMEAPDSLKAEPGKHSLDYLNSALRRAAIKYNRTRDHDERVQILGKFIRDWDPDKAEALGISREGYIEPTGLWKVLDVVDIIFDRWARVAGETLWEHKETNAANVLAGKEKAGIGNLGHLWKQNWEEDKGQLGKGGEAIKNWALYMTTPFGIDTQEEAEEIFNRSAGYDAAEQDVADSITSGWHNMMGVVKGRSREETEFIIDEALAAGGTGGHMAIDLVGLMGVSSLNFAGLGPFKGAMQGARLAPLAKNLTQMGLKINPLGNARSARLEMSAMPLARKSMIDELEGVVVGAEKVGPPTEARAALDELTRLSNDMAAVETELSQIRGLRERAQGGRVIDEIGDVVDKATATAAAADLDRRAAPLIENYKRLMGEFDEGFNALSEIGGKGRIPGEVLFGGIQARAIGIVGKEVGNAVTLALQGGVKSGPVGAQSVPMLADARAWALEGGLSVTEVEKKWVAALKEGEKNKKVVVSLGASAEGGQIKTAPVWLSPGEARVYEQAKEGLHGSKAAVAAYYPDKKMLQRMMGKEKFARLAEQAADEIISVAHGRGFGGSGRRAIAGGVRALRGKTKADTVFQADRIVTNVEPLTFAINHALIKKAAWIESVRLPLAGVASLSRRPMHYATKGADGKWAPIARKDLIHPGMFHKMTNAERQRKTDAAYLRAQWPVWKARFEEAAGDNPELLKLGRQAYELGWASREVALATGEDIIKLASVEKLNETIDTLVRLGKDADLGEGRILTVLSKDDVRQAEAAIAHLRTNTKIDTKVFEDLLDGYVDMTAGAAKDLASLAGGLGGKARAEYLEGLRAQAHYLLAAAKVTVDERIGFQAELAVGRIAEDFKPELKHISDELGKIQSQLAATTADVVKVDESAEQLRAALLAVGKGGDEAAAEALIKESDEFVNAYKKTLEDFRRSVAEEFGDEAAELADEALTGAKEAKALGEPIEAVATVEGVSYRSLEDKVREAREDLSHMGYDAARIREEPDVLMGLENVRPRVVSIDDIPVQGNLSAEKSRRAVEFIESGEEAVFPPRVNLNADGSFHSVNDGRHRLEALRAMGKKHIVIDVELMAKVDAPPKVRSAEAIPGTVRAVGADISRDELEDVFWELSGMDGQQKLVAWIAENSNVPSYRAIANRISPYVSGEFRVLRPDHTSWSYAVDQGRSALRRGADGVFVHTPGEPGGFLGVKGWGNRYADGGDGIALEVALHELVHSATIFQIERGLSAPKGSALAKSVESLSDLAVDIRDALGRSRSFDDLRHVALDDITELVAYGLTSPKFQETLKGIKVEGGKTAFNKFVDLLAEILGLKGKEVSALSELIRVTDEILDAPIPAARKFDGEILPKFEEALDVKAVKTTPTVRSPLPLSDSAQAYVDSVRVAWNTGDEVPITSLFDAMWSRLDNELDPTMLGKRDMSGVNLPAGAKAILTRLGDLSKKLDGTNASLMKARAGDSAIDLAEAEANYNKAKTAYDTARRSYEPVRRPDGSIVSKGKVYTNLHGLKLDNKLIHKAGSQERRILEALELHYKNRMASITSHVANEAEAIRKASKEALANLPDSLIKKGFVTAGRGDELRAAVDKLSVTLFGRDISVKLPATKDMSADILLKKAVAKARRSKDPRERAAVLMAEIGKIEQKLAKVGDGLPENDLAAAIKELDRARTKKKAMPKKDVQIHVDKFLDEIRDADFDLRHPDDVSRAIENRLTSQYNVIESEKLLFKARLEALRSADIADYIPNLSPGQRARITSLLKNKKLRNVLPGSDGGPAILLKDTQKRLTAAQSRLAKYLADGAEEAASKQRTLVAGLEEQVRILGNEEDVKRVVHVAKEMKEFFDMHLERLVEAGVIDKAFDAEEFFARVDVGAFFPHILSQAAVKRAAGFGVGGAGRIGRSLVQYFGKERKIAGIIEDINEGKRALRAEQLLFHAARRGAHGEAAAQAAAKGSGELKKFIKDSGQSYDDLVDEIKEGALLAEYDELFESDVLVAMEYYHRKGSEAVADARFIKTTLDLFPNGRLIAQIGDVKARNRAAEDLGYVPLGEVEYLQSILQKQLPKGLKRLSKDLKMRVINGADLDEIGALVRAELGHDVPADVLHALTSDKLKVPYVPIQVKEYLNWRNSSDAFLAKKTVGTEVWDGLQAWAKAQATIVALAHIGRNVIGNIVSTVQEIGFGAVNFDTQLKAMRIWGSWGDDNLKAVINIGPHSMSVQDWRKTFSSRGFYDEALSSDFLEEATGLSRKAIPTAKQVGSQLAGTTAGALTGMALGSAFGVGAPVFFLGGALGMMAGKRWSGVKAVRGGKTYKRMVGDAVDEIKASPKEGIVRTGEKITGGVAGGVIGSAFFGVGAIPGAFIGATSMGDFVKMMGGLNQAAESQARLSMAVGLLKRGDDIDTALMKVNRSLRDYSDLTPLEKNVFRRFFFFYTWEAGNLKYQLNWMKENPGTARMLSAFTKGIYQMQFTEEDIARLPEHYRYPVVVRSGPAKVIALSGLPHQPILELFRSKEGMPIQGLATRMSPPLLAFMEMTFGGGKSFYYGKPIKELNNINQLKDSPPLLKMIFGYPDKPNYYVPVYKNGVKTGRTREVRKSENPVMFYMAKKLPGWRWMNQYMNISSESFNSYALEAALTPEDEEAARATAFERMMMFTVGWRQTSIDWDYQGYKVSKEMEDRMLDMLNSQFPMAVGQRRYLRKKLSASPNETVSDVEE